MDATEARNELRAIVEKMDLAHLKALAVHCIRTATPIAAWNLGVVLEVLAARFDRRSFVNICEAIHAEVGA